MNTKYLFSELKEAIKFLSTPLLLLWFVIFLLLSLGGCSTKETPEPECGTPATVRDLTGLDGCRYVLELENGERLEPSLDTCMPNERCRAAILGLVLSDNQKVVISWEALNTPSICMVGQTVRITCIKEIPVKVIN